MNLEYPKIETALDRDPKTFKVIRGAVRLLEFLEPRRWLVTEKIDGTNIRVVVDSGGTEFPTTVSFQGRTDKADIPPFLLKQLEVMFPPQRCAEAFGEVHTKAVLFGEGYGARIQKGGRNYRNDTSFRLFDVIVLGERGRLWWLNWEDVRDIARKLGIHTVPVIDREVEFWYATDQASGPSLVAQEEGTPDTKREGIVCRTDPLLFMRDGRPLMWKLKARDF